MTTMHEYTLISTAIEYHVEVFEYQDGTFALTKRLIFHESFRFSSQEFLSGDDLNTMFHVLEYDEHGLPQLRDFEYENEEHFYEEDVTEDGYFYPYLEDGAYSHYGHPCSLYDFRVDNHHYPAQNHRYIYLSLSNSSISYRPQ